MRKAPAPICRHGPPNHRTAPEQLWRIAQEPSVVLEDAQESTLPCFVFWTGGDLYTISSREGLKTIQGSDQIQFSACRIHLARHLEKLNMLAALNAKQQKKCRIVGKARTDKVAQNYVSFRVRDGGQSWTQIQHAIYPSL
jgi:hypothetical protein